jgi:hypothetical protein
MILAILQRVDFDAIKFLPVLHLSLLTVSCVTYNEATGPSLLHGFRPFGRGAREFRVFPSAKIYSLATG